MGILAWLGLTEGDETKNLDAIYGAIVRAMPDAEPVVHRYVATVVVLLGRAAHADRDLTEAEEVALRGLLAEVDRLPLRGIDTICELLRAHAATVTEHEIGLCYREVKALCDAKERLGIVRVVAATAYETRPGAKRFSGPRESAAFTAP